MNEREVKRRDTAAASAISGFVLAIDVFLHGPAMWRVREETRRRILAVADELKATLGEEK